MRTTATATNEDENGFRLKTIATLGNSRTVRILTQNENGPCPLLALANVLLLRSDISIGESKKRISFEALVELLGDYLIRHTSEASNDNLMDAINLIPTLQNGLDVNVTFDSVFGFETTPSLALFAAFGVPLCHGWVYESGEVMNLKLGPAASSSEVAAPTKWSGVAGYKELMSYNQLVEAVVNGQVAAMELGLTLEIPSTDQAQKESFADVPPIESQILETKQDTPADNVASPDSSAGDKVVATEPESLETRVVGLTSENLDGSVVGNGANPQNVSDNSAVSNLSEKVAELTLDAFIVPPDAAIAPVVTEPGVECVDTHEDKNTLPPDSVSTAEAIPVEPAPVEQAPIDSVADEPVATVQVTTEPVANDIVVTEPVNSELVSEEASVVTDPAATDLVVSELTTASVPAETVAPDALSQEIVETIVRNEAVQSLTENNGTADSGVETVTDSEPPVQVVETFATSEDTTQIQADYSSEARIAEELHAEKELARAAEKREGKKVVSKVEVPKNTVDVDPAKKADLEKQVALGQAADLFLSTTSTQLTSAGLNQLVEKIEPARLSVLFRNNHFSTLFNHPQLGLFTLVTDEGFLTKKCVWETLCLDGDGVFVDGEFGAYAATASDEGLDGGAGGGAVDIAGVDVAEQERAWKAIVEGGGDAVGVPGGGDVDNDLAFAMSLQEEENRRAQPNTPPAAHSRQQTATSQQQQQSWDMKQHLQGLRGKARKKDAGKPENECAIQ
ncbi:hypothetical protein HDU81_003477 [Chytriomyces hyalinus]|nr:hypothetical protein HDU81_003477 [Chytriomyces hyalinus]